MNLHRGVYMYRAAEVEPGLPVIQGSWGTGHCRDLDGMDLTVTLGSVGT